MDGETESREVERNCIYTHCQTEDKTTSLGCNMVIQQFCGVIFLA